MNVLDRARVVLSSVVTWATVISAVLTAVVTQLQSTDILPSNWTGPIISVAVVVTGVLGVTIAVIKQVMPVPAEGMQVVLDDGDILPVERGWE